MQKSEVIEQIKKKQPESVIYSVENIAKTTELFSIFIKIDQKIKNKGSVIKDEKTQD